jgi:hypothetical protein
MQRRPLPLFAATAAIALAGALMAPLAEAATYQFSQTGFTGGGAITGSFTGNDLDGDGWLYGYEITAFSLAFSGNADVPAFSHAKSSLGGIGYRIGENVIGGHPESYLTTSRTQNGHHIVYDAFGWPEFTIPGRITDDTTGKVLTTAESILVTGVGVVPEPAGWALMLGGLGAVGSLARRRGARR